jgi:hypothetical protein
MLLASEQNCRREAFACAVSILDRFLANSSPLDIDKLQLTAAASLLLAEKLEDNTRIKIDVFQNSINERHSL